jgi:ribosomal protein L11 methyltransferase
MTEPLADRHSRDIDSRLADLLARLDPGQIWRPVPGPDGTLLARGSGPDVKTLKTFVAGLDFTGKSVIDLGCNLGFFTFLACRLGAVSALGLDSDPEVVAAASLLAELHGLPQARFAVRDFLAEPGEDQADLVLAIDFIGRGVIAKGRLRAVLTAASGLARREMFFTLRPIYALADLPAPQNKMREIYGDFIRRGRLHLAECVGAWLGPAWAGRAVGQGSRLENSLFKAAMLFTKTASLP